jgi:hypothetical protein
MATPFAQSLMQAWWHILQANTRRMVINLVRGRPQHKGVVALSGHCQAHSAMYDPCARTLIAELLQRGSKFGPKGNAYAFTLPLASAGRSCSDRCRILAADRVIRTIHKSVKSECNSGQDHSPPRQGQLHEQRHVSEQHWTNRQTARELFVRPAGRDRAMQRWNLQFQPEQTRHVFTSRRCCEMALSPNT